MSRLVEIEGYNLLMSGGEEGEASGRPCDGWWEGDFDRVIFRL